MARDQAGRSDEVAVNDTAGPDPDAKGPDPVWWPEDQDYSKRPVEAPYEEHGGDDLGGAVLVGDDGSETPLSTTRPKGPDPEVWGAD